MRTLNMARGPSSDEPMTATDSLSAASTTARMSSRRRSRPHCVQTGCRAPSGSSPRWLWALRTHTIPTVSELIDIRYLAPSDIELLNKIDRSEVIDTLYSVQDHELVARTVDVDVPDWSREGDGEHSVRQLVEHWRPIAEAGATLLGAYDGDEFLGLAMVVDQLEPGMAWLGLLHVGRPHRRRGAAQALWNAAAEIGRSAGATSMYVSATPSGSAVGFYLDRGCELADPPNPDLLADEPEDIHFVCPIG